MSNKDPIWHIAILATQTIRKYLRCLTIPGPMPWLVVAKTLVIGT